MPGVISPWLFKRGHFESPLVLDIFFTLSFKYKTSEISPELLCHKIVNTMFQRKHNYVVLMTLQISGQGGTRTAGSVWWHFNMSRKWAMLIINLTTMI